MSTDRPHAAPVPPPSRHQLALMIWLAVLPTSTVLDVRTVPRTVVLATVAVPIVMSVVMPRLHRLRARLLLRRAA
jgi:hypothetical protein